MNAAARARPEAEGPFDLVLLDCAMPGTDGVAGLAEARSLDGGDPVAPIPGAASRAAAQEAPAAGAAGSLPKTLAARSMLDAVRFMAMGETFVPPDFMTAAEPEAESHPLPRPSPRASAASSTVCAAASPTRRWRGSSSAAR